MKAIDRPFTQIINGTTQFVIPVFQRDYSWTETQCQQLWKDVLRMAQGKPEHGHFLGSVVYISTGDSAAGFTRWLLIDGQQRMTTLTLLLLALRDHIAQTGWHGGENDPTAKRVEANFLKNILEDGMRQYKLVLRRHDQATLQALLDRTELPAQPSLRIQENYEFFCEQLAAADPAQIYTGLSRLVIVDVTLQHGYDDPQLVFESLNSTGLDLSQSDLIRNFILMRLPEREQTYFYEQYWSKIEALFRGSDPIFDNFVRDYIALKNKASKQEKASDIYQAFRMCFAELVQKLGGVEALLADMRRFAGYYAAFSIGGYKSAPLADALARLRRLVDAPALLVMALFDCYDHHRTLSEAALLEALTVLESYIFRRAICGEQTRGYWQVFANIAYKVLPATPLESLQVELARLRENYRFPSDDEFRRELAQRDLYGLRVCSYLLERLENDGSKEPSNTSGYSIEHIMPQNENLPSAWRDMLGPDWPTIQKAWLHRLGNLTLTGYNSTYSDRPFADKKSMRNGFSESAIRLNKFVREQAVWTPTEMARRSELLVTQALKIWPSLVVETALIEAARLRDLRELADRRDISKVAMTATAKALFEALRKALFAIDSTILEVAEAKSVSYYGPDFFLEVLPRTHRLLLILPLNFTEVNDPADFIKDAAQWKFFFYAKHEAGVLLDLDKAELITKALPVIRQALTLGR